MTRLVSLERVKFILNVIHSHDDVKLDMFILAASYAVLDYLGVTYAELVDDGSSDGPDPDDSDLEDSSEDSDSSDDSDLEDSSEDSDSSDDSDLEDSDLEDSSEGADPVEVNPVPELEQVATAMLVARMYDGWDPRDVRLGRLPSEVEALLYIRKRELGIA